MSVACTVCLALLAWPCLKERDVGERGLPPLGQDTRAGVANQAARATAECRKRHARVPLGELPVVTNRELTAESPMIAMTCAITKA